MKTAAIITKDKQAIYATIITDGFEAVDTLEFDRYDASGNEADIQEEVLSDYKVSKFIYI